MLLFHHMSISLNFYFFLKEKNMIKKSYPHELWGEVGDGPRLLVPQAAWILIIFKMWTTLVSLF